MIAKSSNSFSGEPPRPLWAFCIFLFYIFGGTRNGCFAFTLLREIYLRWQGQALRLFCIYFVARDLSSVAGGGDAQSALRHRRYSRRTAELILNFNPPQGWLFTASARQSVQAPSALTLSAALNFEFPKAYRLKAFTSSLYARSLARIFGAVCEGSSTGFVAVAEYRR